MTCSRANFPYSSATLFFTLVQRALLHSCSRWPSIVFLQPVACVHHLHFLLLCCELQSSNRADSYLRRFITGFSRQKLGFGARGISYEICFGWVVLGRFFFQVLLFCPVSCNSTSDPYSSIIHGCYNRSINRRSTPL